jgi:hypothetical protein
MACGGWRGKYNKRLERRVHPPMRVPTWACNFSVTNAGPSMVHPTRCTVDSGWILSLARCAVEAAGSTGTLDAEIVRPQPAC